MNSLENSVLCRAWFQSIYIYIYIYVQLLNQWGNRFSNKFVLMRSISYQHSPCLYFKHLYNICMMYSHASLETWIFDCYYTIREQAICNKHASQYIYYPKDFCTFLILVALETNCASLDILCSDKNLVFYLEFRFLWH